MRIKGDSGLSAQIAIQSQLAHTMQVVFGERLEKEGKSQDVERDPNS
jgi:hypothetical protein